MITNTGIDQMWDQAEDLVSTHLTTKKVAELRMVAIPFTFRNHEYYSLVRIKTRGEGTKLEVTIMNGDLEKIFYGYHVFEVNQTEITCVSEPMTAELSELHNNIRQALHHFIHQHRPTN